jgi:hypothetical protein
MALHRRLCLNADIMKGELRELLIRAVEGVLHPNFALLTPSVGRVLWGLVGLQAVSSS